MGQQLEALAPFPEGPGSLPSTYMTAQSVIPIIGVLTPLHRHSCRYNTKAHKTKKIRKTFSKVIMIFFSKFSGTERQAKHILLIVTWHSSPFPKMHLVNRF